MPDHSSVEAGHELSGVHTRGVWIFILWFAVSMAAILLGVWVVMGLTAKRLERLDQANVSPIGRDEPRRHDQPLQPSPLHQSLDWQDMASLRDAQLKALHQYGRIRGDDTHAQIPIDRAMNIVLQHPELLTAPDGKVVPLTQPAINTTQPAPTENRT